MTQAPAGQTKRTCFVVIGFGKRTDFETGRTLDLDKTYRQLIKPAVEAAGLECQRADEISYSGLVDVIAYEKLLTADVVVADLSTLNRGVFYQLGVRHALRPHTTIVICEDGVKSFPFDINKIIVRQYHHMGEGLDFEEVMRFRDVLAKAITETLGWESQPQTDSPVYTFLNGLRPPARAGVTPGPRDVPPAEAPSTALAELMEEAAEAQRENDFVGAKSILTLLRRRLREAAPARPEDPDVIRRLALVTYKSKVPTPLAALEEARDLLTTLDPATSNDTETLDLWASVHKRLWSEAGRVEYLDEAVRARDRGFYLRDDHHNGINLAFLDNVSAAALSSQVAAASAERAPTLRAEAVMFFVQAERVRREVLAICQKALDTEPLNDGQRYWVLATMAEAHLGLGAEHEAEVKLREAESLGPAQWMRENTKEQMDKLRALLADSPFKYVSGDAA